MIFPNGEQISDQTLDRQAYLDRHIDSSKSILEKHYQEFQSNKEHFSETSIPRSSSEQESDFFSEKVA